jgi:hypothetical protein
MTQLKILSANTPALLEKEAEKYNISSLGSISISNGHFYLAILGSLKEVPVVPKVEPDVTKETPKVTPKASAKAKPK